MSRSRIDARGALCVALLMIACACGRATRSPLDEQANRFVRLAVALGERDPDSLDFYAGPAAAVADLRSHPPSLPEIKRQAAMLSAEISRGASDANGTSRAAALVADLSALAARVDLLTGKRVPFNAESLAFFGIAPAPLDQRRMNDIRAQISAIVGREGRLVERYAAFAERFTIPPERLSAVMTAAVDECRSKTLAHVVLPPGESVTLEFVRDRPWSAFSRYLGGARSAIQINTDFRFTIDQALQIACHEGYPGHHARNVTMASAPGAEHSVQLMFSRSALASEASAMLAVDVAFPPAERLRVERVRLFPIAGLDPAGADQHVAVERLVGDLQIAQADIARRYLDGDLEFARAVAALEEQALVPHAEAMIKYMNEYRSYVTVYTTGREIFAARLAACAGANPAEGARWRCFESAMSTRRP